MARALHSVRRNRVCESSLRLLMKLLFSLALVFAALASATLHAQSPAPTEMVDQLISKNIEAKGGATALQNLKTLRVKGKMLVQQGQIELGYLEIKKRPDEVRSEGSLQGMTQVEAYDGKEGWKISPFQGRKDPEKMSADDTKALWEDSEVDGPLVDWKEKGSTVESLGTEDVDGTQAYKLKVTRKNGDVTFVYLDPDHFLEIRTFTQRMQNGAMTEVETDLSDYEKVNNVYVPFSMESGRKGDPDKQKLIIDKAEGNVPVDEAAFRFPAGTGK